MKTILYLFILLLCNSIMLQAIDVKGRIIDAKTKKPVEFVTTVLLKSDSTYISGCQTDTTGIFSIGGHFQKQDYLLKASYLGYKTTYIKINNLSKDIDLGDIEIDEESKALGEVTVTGNRIINKVDRQIIMPDSMQVKTSVNAFDLLSNMSLSRLIVDPVNRTVKVGNEEVQLRINGVKSSVQEVVAIRSQDILRVEYFEDPGVRFGNENVGAVVNFIVNRQKNHGGYTSIDGRNAPFVGFGDDTYVFKTNYKASEFGLNYYVNYRSYDDRWTNQHETLNIPNNKIVREQKGVKAPMEYQYHNANVSYNLTKVDNYVFNAVFKNQFYRYDNTTLFNNYYTDKPNPTFSQGRYKGKDYTPALDLYFRKDMKNKQSLAINIVGTYIDLANKSWYDESDKTGILSDIYNYVDGNKYSIIGEAVYEKQFEKMTFSAGAKHTQGIADNVYMGSADTKTKMQNTDSYLFAQIQGKLSGKLGYTVGLGGARIWYKEGKDNATFYMLRPSVQLSYPIKDYLTVKYTSAVRTRTPGLGQLSNVEQQIDAYQINRGNPNLKPSNTYDNKLIISLDKGLFNISTTLAYMYFDKIAIQTYSVENNKIISLTENHKGQHYLFWSTNATVKIIKDIWTVDGWIDLHRDEFKSNDNKTLSYSGIVGSLKSNLIYKNWHLVAGFNTRYKDIWGEYKNFGDDWSYVEAGYKYKEAKLSLGMSYPFKNYWSRGYESLSAVKPTKSWTYIEGNGHMLYLRFAWSISFGRKHEAGKKSLDNSDTDKGVL